MRTYKEWNENNLQYDVKHMISNYVHGIETSLDSLKQRITSGKTNEALNAVNDIQLSISMINKFLAQME